MASNLAKEESLYEEIDESKINSTSYTFDDPDNCLVEHEDEENTPESKPKKIYDKLPGLVRR